MSRRYVPGILAALAVAFAAPALNSVSAQQSNPSLPEPYRHIASDSMSAADRAAVESHQVELVQTARLYAYDLEAEHWIFDQTICAAMPDTILLHYREIFPNGTQSLFTALIPRTSGRVHVVPVLYHNATPYQPAPKNPHNYVLFNMRVPGETAKKDVTANGNWLELGACYAEMTGGDINIPSNPPVDVGSATAPFPAAHIDVTDKTVRVSFADRESEQKYRVWSISFNRYGKVTFASTDDRPVYAAKPMIQVQAARSTPGKQHARGAARAANATVENSSISMESAKGSTASASTAGPESSSPASPTAAFARASGQESEPSAEPGWRLVTNPAQPPSKIVPPGPPPPEKIKPEPPDPTGQSATPQAQ